MQQMKPENPKNNTKTKQFPASNVARFDGLHRDQGNAENQTIDVAQRDLKGKDHKFKRS